MNVAEIVCDSIVCDNFQVVAEMTMNYDNNEDVKHLGGCHCGAVRFEIWAPQVIKVYDCNCSICTKKELNTLLVAASNFKIIRGHQSLSTYTFNTHQAKHTFCKRCGVQSFYVPRCDSEAIGVMPNCLDPGTVKKIRKVKFNGLDYESSVEALKSKTACI